MSEPKPASPKPTNVINMQPPVSGARILSADQLSPSERLILERALGHDGVSDVPTDLGERLASTLPPEQLQARIRQELEAAARAMPPNSIAVPKDLDMSSIKTVQVTDADLQEAFKGNTDNLAASAKIAAAKAAQAANPATPPVALGTTGKTLGEMSPDATPSGFATPTNPPSTHIPAPVTIAKPTVPHTPFNPQLAQAAPHTPFNPQLAQAAQQQVAATQPAAPPPVAPTAVQQPYDPMLRSFEQARQEGISAVQQQEEMAGMHPAVAQAYKQTMSTAPAQEQQAAPPQQAVSSQTSTTPPPYAKAATAETGDDRLIAELSKKKLSEMTKEETAEFRRLMIKSVRDSVDPYDYKRYITAVINGQLYTKTYHLLDGRLAITFAESYSKDSEAIGKQMRYHRLTERITNDIEQDTELIRLSVTAALRAVQHRDDNDQWQTSYQLDTQIAVSDALTPEQRTAYLADSDPHPGDTNLFAMSQAIHRQFANGSIRQLIYRTFERFNTHMQQLHILGQNVESF